LKKTLQVARDVYTNSIKDFLLRKKKSPYMKLFHFTVSKAETGFVNKNAVSAEVLEKIMKAKMKMKTEVRMEMEEKIYLFARRMNLSNTIK